MHECLRQDREEARYATMESMQLLHQDQSEEEMKDDKQILWDPDVIDYMDRFIYVHPHLCYLKRQRRYEAQRLIVTMVRISMGYHYSKGS